MYDEDAIQPVRASVRQCRGGPRTIGNSRSDKLDIETAHLGSACSCVKPDEKFQRLPNESPGQCCGALTQASTLVPMDPCVSTCLLLRR